MNNHLSFGGDLDFTVPAAIDQIISGATVVYNYVECRTFKYGSRVLNQMKIQKVVFG